MSDYREVAKKIEIHCTFVGYQLGLHVACMILNSDLKDRVEDQIDALESLARGETTPFASGAELRQEFPDAEDLEAALRGNLHGLQRAANVVLDRYLKNK